MYFTTTGPPRAERGHLRDVIIDEAHDSEAEHPFKGNVDLDKFQKLIDEVGPERIPYISLAITVNMAGGQPVSMANIRAVSELAHSYGIKVIMDATRCAENACFIKHREPGYEDKSIREIIREQFSYADGCTMSGKKDGIVNIGGFLGLNDEDLYRKPPAWWWSMKGCRATAECREGIWKHLPEELYEAADYNFLAHRLAQVEYLHDKLNRAGIPIVKPAGACGLY